MERKNINLFYNETTATTINTYETCNIRAKYNKDLPWLEAILNKKTKTYFNIVKILSLCRLLGGDYHICYRTLFDCSLWDQNLQISDRI